jgi:sugar phosphate permease
VFLQLHLVLGLLLGPLADRAFDQAKGPALIAAAVLVVAVVVFWRIRRRKRAAAPGAWMEASCPACIGVSLLTGRVPGLAGLTAPDPVRPEPGDEPRVLVS